MLDPTTPVGTARRARRRVHPRAYSTRDVIEKLIGPHHTYLRDALPFLQRVAAKVARDHGDRDPSLVELATQLDIIAAALTAHMDEEESVLFPALLEGREREAVALLFDMRRDHEELQLLLHELRLIARDYRPPGWACNSYRTLMYELRALEADVFEHLRIETRILLPRFVP
ncbi:MAG: hemerythrin domain-containing protein [Myxococcales bacterium]|nr:hemerythrin domain-containing protein [Myxococcales bacterium]